MWWKTHVCKRSSVFQNHRRDRGWGGWVSMAGECSGKKWTCLWWRHPQRVVDYHGGSLLLPWAVTVSTEFIPSLLTVCAPGAPHTQPSPIARGSSGVAASRIRLYHPLPSTLGVGLSTSPVTFKSFSVEVLQILEVSVPGPSDTWLPCPVKHFLCIPGDWREIEHLVITNHVLRNHVH